MRTLLISVAAIALATTPATAASIIVTYAATQGAIPANNNFKTNLNGEGLADYATMGATLTLSGPAKITFHFMGSESGFNDTFSFIADSTLGANSLTETSGFTPWSTTFIGTGTYNAGGDLAALLDFTSLGGMPAGPGDDGFAVFLPGTAVSGDDYTTLFFGYDDQLSLATPPDDNHDDFIVRATISAIPEPATWALMIGGFGLVGAAMRRRTRMATAIA